MFIQEGKNQPISLQAAAVGLESGQNFDEEHFNAIIKVFGHSNYFIFYYSNNNICVYKVYQNQF